MFTGCSLYLGPNERASSSDIGSTLFRGMTFMIPALFFIGAILPISAYGSNSDSILTGGQTYESIVLDFPEGGGIDPSLSIPLERGGPILSGSLLVSTMEDEIGPGSVSIDIGMDGRQEWSFGGGSQGTLGEQDSFLSGESLERVLLSEEEEHISFLLPVGAELEESSIAIISPPSPVLKDTAVIDADPSLIEDVTGLVAGDTNGDGSDEIFYHSSSDNSIYMMTEGASGTFSRSLLLSGIEGEPMMGTIENNSEQVGGLIIQYSNGSSSGERISFLSGKTNGVMEEMILSVDVPSGNVGFSILQAGSESRSMIMIADNDGVGASMITFDEKGSHTKQMFIDNSSSIGGVGTGDMDGNGRIDLIIFPDSGEDDIIVFLSGVSSNSSSYSLSEEGENISISGPGVSLDINGNGMDEFYFPYGQDGEVGVISMSKDGEIIFSNTGLGLNGSILQVLPRDLYGDSGIFAGGDGYLSIGSRSGLYQTLPVNDPLDDHIRKEILGYNGPATMGGISSSGDGYIYHIEKDIGLMRSSVEWIGCEEVDLIRDGRTLKIDPLTMDTTDISYLLGSEISRGSFEDEFGNTFKLIDISLEGLDGFIRMDALSIYYDVTLSASGSSTFLPSLDRAFRDLGGSSIPFMVTSSSEGSVKIGPVDVTYDSPPLFLDSLPKVLTIDEGSMGQTLMNTRDHVIDDLLPSGDLRVSIMPETDIPEGLLLTDRNGDIISHASRMPDLNGQVRFRLNVSDGTSSTISPVIVLNIEPVQDPPELVVDPGEVLLTEGEGSDIILSGEDGLFSDPDGDRLYFTSRIVVSEPVKVKEYLDISIDGYVMTLIPMIEGNGGTGLIEVKATDDPMSMSRAATVMIPFSIEDVDADPYLDRNPGPLVLSEDQDTPTKIPLDGWVTDPDTPLAGYELLSYSSDPRLITYFDLEGNSPSLVIIPTGDLVGSEFIWVEVAGDNITITDRLEVEIQPINDLPEVIIEDVDFQEGIGWVISGKVIDPDDNGGRIEYRIGSGEWRDAWGFRTWSFLVEEDIIPGSGSYVFIRADDSNDLSAVEFTKLLWPYDPPDPVDDPEDDPDDDDPEDPYEYPENSLTPDDPGSSGPPWYIAGGLWGIIIGGLIFLIWTETGFVTIMTGMMSIYSKLSKKDILNHEIRGLIRGYIIANPGDHYSSIKRNLDLNNGTLAYHLRVLEQNGFIKSMYDGIYKRYYPANININKLKKNVSKQEEIFNIILESPGITMEEIGRTIGVSRQVVNYHVKNLIRARVVTYTRDSKSARFYPSESPKQYDQT